MLEILGIGPSGQNGRPVQLPVMLVGDRELDNAYHCTLRWVRVTVPDMKMDLHLWTMMTVQKTQFVLLVSCVILLLKHK